LSCCYILLLSTSFDLGIMSSERYESLEEEFLQLYEEVKRKLSDKIQQSRGEERKKQLRDADRQLDDLESTICDMEGEIRQAPYPYRNQMGRKVKVHRENLAKLCARCKEAKDPRLQQTTDTSLWLGPSDVNDEINNQQRVTVLQSNTALSRASESLYRAHQVALETDDIGNEIITELGEQRESLVRTKDRLSETDNNLVRSRKILKSMYLKVITNKLILIVIIVLEIAILLGIVYWKFFT